jgi:hypothetical protein
MPVIIPDLSTRIRTKLLSAWSGIGGQVNSSYAYEFCDAIAQGLGQSINEAGFITDDTGLRGSPLVAGAGNGAGIFIEKDVFSMEMYQRIQTKSKAFAASLNTQTINPDWPPPPSNALFRMTNAIAEATDEVLTTQTILISNHPQIYQGNGIVREYTQIDESIISGIIISSSPNLQGVMWPQIADAIAEAYYITLQNHSFAEVTITGSCSSGGGQSCGINSIGVGTGQVE